MPAGHSSDPVAALDMRGADKLRALVSGLRPIVTHRSGLISVLLGLASFALFLRTLAPDVVDADGGEFQFAAWNFAFVHPTGYPLYLILGGLFQHIVPIGNPAYRLNLFTAVCGALAVVALYWIVEELTRQSTAALCAAAFFAVTRVFWFDSSGAEAYALNAFFVAILVLLALRRQSAPTTRRFAAFAIVFGLALTHHRSIILWIPAFAVFFFLAAKGIKAELSRDYKLWSRVLLIVLCAVVPLSLYLYVPLRAPAAPYATLALGPGREIALYDGSPTGLVNYVLGRVFQSELRWDATSLARLEALPQMMLDQFGALGVMLGIAGVLVMVWRREWARLSLFLVAVIAVVLFASLYHIGDILHYYIPAYLVWAICIGVALARIAMLVRESRIATAALTTLAILVPLVQLAFNLPTADRSSETEERAQWTRILSAAIPEHAILISNDRDEIMPLWYIQYVENTRRDLTGLFPLITPAPEYRDVVRLTDTALDTGRPVFFIKPMPGLQVKYRLADRAPLEQVVGRAADIPPQYVCDVRVGGKLRIAGYGIQHDAGTLRVSVYWQALEKLDGDYTSFLHLVNARGDKVAQGDDHQVGGDFYPTMLWSTGETLVDTQVITLPSALPAAGYRLVAGMYSQPGMQFIGEPAEIGTVSVY